MRINRNLLLIFLLCGMCWKVGASEERPYVELPPSIQWLIEVIETLPSDEPQELGTPGYNRYTTQKAHWLGWLNPNEYTGSFERRGAEHRDAAFVYNHIIEVKMLLWLVKESGLDEDVQAAVRAAAAEGKTLAGKSAAVRRVVPWPMMEEALRKRVPGAVRGE